MKDKVLNYWRQLETRQQLILGWGSAIVGLILFYAIIWQPWHYAIAQMEEAIQGRRESLVWMRQSSEMVKSGAIVDTNTVAKDADQSLLSVIEKTARVSKVNKSIQQMVPGNNIRTNNEQVNVVLEEADFNQWVRWIDDLSNNYSVNITQLSVESETDEPNIVELRVTFERS